ncbi:hypothetical protein FPZ47_23755, partial [Mycobacterium helveticum]
APEIDPTAQDYCAERTAMMPRRTRTRAQHRAARIATERIHNRDARTARRKDRQSAYFGPHEPTGDDEPPLF